MRLFRTWRKYGPDSPNADETIITDQPSEQIRPNSIELAVEEIPARSKTKEPKVGKREHSFPASTARF